MREKIRLKDIAIHSKGKQINGIDLVENGRYNYLNGGINPSGKWNEFNNEGNTITISEGGNSSGYVNYMVEPFWCGAHCYYLYGVKGNSKYLYYALKSKQEEIMRLRTGTAMPNIKKSTLSEFSFTYDNNVVEQAKVVQILEKTEKIIGNLRAQLIELDNLIKSRFVEMFGDPNINPKEYEVKKMDEISEIIKGITYSPEQISDNGMIVLRSGNIKGNIFDLSDIKRINKVVKEDKWVKGNDILMCNRNGSANLVGKVAKIPMTDENMTFGTFMTIVRSDYFEYLFAFFQTEAFRKQIQFQTSVAINQISIPLLASVKVPFPTLEEQKEFSIFAQQVDKLKFSIQQSLDETQKLFDSLMQEYFR